MAMPLILTEAHKIDNKCKIILEYNMYFSVKPQPLTNIFNKLLFKSASYLLSMVEISVRGAFWCCLPEKG